MTLRQSGPWTLGVLVVGALLALGIYVVLYGHPSRRFIRSIPVRGDITAPVISFEVADASGIQLQKGGTTTSTELMVDVSITDNNPNATYTVDLDGSRINPSGMIKLNHSGTHAFLVEATDGHNTAIFVFEFMLEGPLPGEGQSRRIVASITQEKVDDYFIVTVNIKDASEADPATWELFPVGSGGSVTGYIPTSSTQSDSGWTLEFSIPEDDVTSRPEMYLVRALVRASVQDVLLTSGRVRTN